jgi:hypothetical protein
MNFSSKMARIRFIAAAASALALVSAPAIAQPAKTAEQWYKEGDDQYNLGNFTGAVEAFKKAFETENDTGKKPAYLYNIAQAYRLAKDCKNSLFFYKRFLALRGNDTVKPLKPTVKAEVEGRITELEACVKSQDDAAGRQPDTTIKPDGTKPDGTKPDITKPDGTKPDGTKPDGTKPDGTKPDGTKPDGTKPDGDPDDDDDKIVPATAAPSQLIAIRVGGGGGIPIIADTSSKFGPTAALTAGYILPITGPVSIEVGAGFSFSSISFATTGSAGDKSAQLFSAFGFGAVTKHFTPAIAVRGELGLGLQLFAGLRAGNPFTFGALDTSGALSMFVARGGIAVDYSVTPKIAIWLAPATFSFSPTSTKNFRAEVKAINRLDFLLGVRVGL